MCEISVVIPCYNSNVILRDLNIRLLDTLKTLKVSFEIIYINDCSIDNTLEILKQLLLDDDSITIVDLMYNVGQHKALFCGFEISRGNYIITMDDDLQNMPEDIPKLYFRAKEYDLDAVIGKYKQKKHSFFRNFGSILIRRIRAKVFLTPKNLHGTSFRCMKRNIVDNLLAYKTKLPYVNPLLYRTTKRIANVEVNHSERKSGKSNYNFLKLMFIALDNIFNYSSMPLKYISVTGIMFSITGLMLAIFYLFRYLQGNITIPGWTTVIILLNVYSGIILFSIGIIGEYLLRVLIEVNGYPKHTIRKIYRSK